MGRLVVSGVSKRFELGKGSVEALRQVGLSLETGQFGALIGPSGCGKSTLLRLVADIAAPSEGSITIDGEPPAQCRRDHRIGFVFQDPALLPWRSVLENVRLPLEVAGKRGVGSGHSPMDLLKLVGLEAFADARPSQLSGGMQQRAAIARALVLAPKLLLLDEPFGALDEITRHKMNLELLRIWQATGTTALMVTHSIQEAVFMADFVFVLAARPGRIVDQIEVGLPRPRDTVTMNDPAFGALVSRVRGGLFGEPAGMLAYG
jgi:NitT/TauT family transport system ATP-binding protein